MVGPGVMGRQIIYCECQDQDSSFGHFNLEGH